ncbi:D-xylose ABC transporter ATP-binding protein [Orenia metallireducens]|uniref:D-xylose ABC transporter ATP-binding protein n=1 Tax=Orenia metallireducens TaxID=1413210 RepID=A0A1C0ACA7_9FIRM|nr:sugar ABC transporter ATP-binding protein [Orenia metallireducens]OCL27988.1 D-xylose ABC transporter ATP-binding protein [Orenia metallireducens]
MDNILEMKNINKSFFGVRALKSVSLEIYRGEIHCLIGENGAGKSTLMKILSGAYQRDSGEILFNGKPLDTSSTLQVQQEGISIIYQEFNLASVLSVAENIFMGREPLNKFGMIDKEKMHANTQEILDKLGVEVSPKALVNKLSVAEQQFVEIAKALSFGAKLIVMDEPSATLTPKELERLFAVIYDLKMKGVSIIYISHHLDELIEIGDRVTVLRDGEHVATDDVDKIDKDQIIRWMVGRDLTNSYPPRTVTPGEKVLEVKNLSSEGVLKDINFSLHKGEILGVAGLVGAGRTELVRALYGADPKDTGEIYLNDKLINVESPKDSIDHGIGLLPEDRKQQGVVLGQSIKNNITLAKIDKITKKILIDNGQERREVQKYIKSLGVKTPSQEMLARNLSGGNQQKVVLAKWMFTNSNILIFDEPTRGIDVGAKYEIYELMNKLTEQGKSIIMISSELPEIIGMSDRVLVMHKGRISSVYDRTELSQEKIMKSAAGEVG